MLSKFAGAAAACALLLSAAGCGSDSSSDSASSGDGSFEPVTIKHKFGETKITKQPKRIVTLGYNDHEFLLKLGVEPVAIRQLVGGTNVTEVPWAKKRIAAMENKPEVIPNSDIKPEQVLALKPDLIVNIFGGMTKREYDALGRSGVPVVAPAKKYVDFGTPWQEQALITGRAVGKEAEAKKQVAEVEDQFAKARKENPEFKGKSGVVPYLFDGDFGAYSSEDLRSRFITDLGFKVPKKIDELAGDEFFVEFSGEQFRLADQDMVLMYGSPRKQRKQVENDRLYKRLDAVKEGRVVYLDNEDFLVTGVSLSSTMSLPYALKEAVPRMAAAVDGDPKTPVKEVQ